MDSVELQALKKTNFCMLDEIKKAVKRHHNTVKKAKPNSVYQQLVQLLDENKKEEVFNLLVVSKSVWDGCLSISIRLQKGSLKRWIPGIYFQF